MQSPLYTQPSGKLRMNAKIEDFDRHWMVIYCGSFLGTKWIVTRNGHAGTGNANIRVYIPEYCQYAPICADAHQKILAFGHP